MESNMFVLASMFLTLALTEPIPDPAIELHAKAIEAKIIAPCCWTQPVSQHYSEAASQIRQQVREMLSAGKSEEQILDFYVSRYGERILASPRARGFNALVYVLPWASLAAGMAVVGLVLRKWLVRRAYPGSAAIPTASAPSADYEARVEKELREFE
jgi:cytochrome c-type biogenesis protein CcmH